MAVEVMPAAVDTFGDYAYLGVKYKKKTTIGFKAYKKYGVNVYDLPDRVVYHGKSSSYSTGVLTGHSPDVVLAISPLSNPQFLKSIGYNYMMVNHTTMAKTSPCRRNPYVKLFSDSGGFQLGRGIEKFIDLDELADFYAHRVDYGIGLDIPLPLPLHYTDWLERMAKVCVANNNYLVKALRNSPTELYDVSHGLSLDARKRFLRIVMDGQSSDNIAIGGIGQSTYDTALTSLVTAVINLCYVFSAVKGKYKRIHILGTTSPIFLTVYSILDRMQFVKTVTADSSTYSQTGIAFHTWLPYVTSEATFPQMYELPKEKYTWRLACNCPICALVGYASVYRGSIELNNLHGLCIRTDMHRIVEEQVNDLFAGNMTVDQLAKRLTVSKKRMFHIVRHLLSMVMSMDKGFDRTYRKYEDKIKSHIRKPSSSLFNVTHQTSTRPKVAKNVTRAIERYEKYHGIK